MTIAKNVIRKEGFSVSINSIMIHHNLQGKFK